MDDCPVDPNRDDDIMTAEMINNDTVDEEIKDELLNTRNSPVIKTFYNDDGTTSNYFDKRRVKIAPRSTLQFKVGPSFSPLREFNQIISDSTGAKIAVSLAPRIDRGFDYINDKWIGYKRNYFTLVTAFDIPGLPLNEVLRGSFKITISNSMLTHKVKYFAVRLMARCAEDKTDINLVQHTAKRDKGPQMTPPIHALIPSTLPNHQTIREASNVRNLSKMKKYDSSFFLHREQVCDNYQPGSLIHSYPEDCIKKVARYERVQFASSINLKKPSQMNKHFKLYVVLGCVVNGDHVNRSPDCPYRGFDCLVEDRSCTFIPIAETGTPPLVIRGRSPSNYSQPVKTFTKDMHMSDDTKTPTPVTPIINDENESPIKEHFEVKTPATFQREKKKSKDIADTTAVPAPSKLKRKYLKKRKTAEQHYDDPNDGNDGYCQKGKSLETMSYIEAVMDKRLPLVLPSTLTVQDLQLLPKTSSLATPLIGMKDIELGPVLHLSHDDAYDMELLSFKNDPFHIDFTSIDLLTGMEKNVIQERKPSSTKRRKLNNKRFCNELSCKLVVPLLSSPQDDGKILKMRSEPKSRCSSSCHDSNVSVSSVSPITFSLGAGDTGVNGYNFNYQPQHCSSKFNDVEAIPRSMLNHQMDISFCLNGDSETSFNRPVSSTGMFTHQLLTANAKPSEIFESNEFYDEPSFYHH